MEEVGAGKEEVVEKLHQSVQRLREVERNLTVTKKEVSTYQDMLEQSQVLKIIFYYECFFVQSLEYSVGNRFTHAISGYLI